MNLQKHLESMGYKTVGFNNDRVQNCLSIVVDTAADLINLGRRIEVEFPGFSNIEYNADSCLGNRYCVSWPNIYYIAGKGKIQKLLEEKGYEPYIGAEGNVEIAIRGNETIIKFGIDFATNDLGEYTTHMFAENGMGILHITWKNEKY